jgi:glycosyltransferase involved in cell wall biosynthesis
MNVLHLSAGNLFGGVESVQVTLARQRDQCPEITPHFALCFEGRLASEIRSTGASVHVLGAVRVSRPWTVWRARRALTGLLKSKPIDVVVCHSVWPHAIFAPVVQSAGLRSILWLHDPARGRHWLERWAKWTRPDAVICNSRFTAQGLPNLYRNVPTKIVYCPVAAGSSITAADRMAVREEMHTAKNAVVVVQVGRMAPLKGHRHLLEALATVADLPGWMCWEIGGAQQAREMRYVEDLKLMAARLGIADRLCFAGQRADVPRVLAAADVYCQPNTAPDTFGLTFIEALLAGLPVVTSAIGGALEIVDSSCGILVPAGDRSYLADSLRRLILDADVRSRLGDAGPARARELCDPRQQLASLRGFLQQCWQRELAA